MTTIYSCFRSCDGKMNTVTIEVEISKGIGLHIIGLADNATKTMLLRTVTALQGLGYHIPGKKIVVNITPSQRETEGFDLAIALGILLESGQIPQLNPFKKGLIYGALTPAGGVLNPLEYISPDDLLRHKHTEGFDWVLTYPSEVTQKYNSVGMHGFSNLREVVEACKDARI